MILECKSCQKKFIVPDNAIPSTGRLVQCSSCGNKWTQFPVSKKITKTKTSTTKEKLVQTKVKKEKPFSELEKKKKKVKKRISPSIYSKEYLEKKHGIKIGDEHSSNNKKILNTNTAKPSYFGFYSYLIIILIFAALFFGLLNLTKEILIFHFPFLQPYIYNLFENINNFKIILMDTFNFY
ncbi:MAG: hypothetical protein CMI78_01140 [Candidatus Pelagibacter sp.]|nr:hypothetical protein [Candidatus Pelagibacter sp.]OUW68168.1 MAG: hypothetical protein CBD62_02145 [Candidatus Pelagibacter sp. TMED202]|tara:strand:- start:4317 stop:4859 length:543 start_codon:yes stop_codon:yes gene_type:complete